MSDTLWFWIETELPALDLTTETAADITTPLPNMLATTAFAKLDMTTIVPVIMTHTAIPDTRVITELDDQD